MGFTWNSKYFLFTVRLNDTLKMVDGLSEQLARLVLADQPLTFYEDLVNAAFYASAEQFSMVEDDPKVSLLFAIAEQFGVKDDLTDYLVSLFLDEKFEVIEKIKLAASLLADEDWDLNESIKAQAYYFLRDKFGIEDDGITYFMELFLHDRFGLTDREPRTAWSDFLIGNLDTLDKSVDYFLPFEMIVDWKDTSIQVAPEAELTRIGAAGIEGETIVSTNYRNRLFEIVCYSSDGMTIQEKEDLKSKIVDILNTTKKESKKLTVQSRGTSFDVRYTGAADIKEGPSFVKMTAQFETGPYGFDMFENELEGSGLIDNSYGDAALGPLFTIKGPVTNPGFRLGGSYFRWNGTVQSGISLCIDFERMTCYTENNFGQKTNALAKLSGEFIKIDAKSSIVLVADSNTESRITTTWRTPVLW